MSPPTLVTMLIAFLFVVGTFAVMGVTAYYSLRILKSLRGGMMSNGWSFICAAVFFLIVGQILLGSSGGSQLSQLDSEFFLFFGSLLQTGAGVLLALGFRRQYNLWHPKKLTQSIAETA